MKRLLKLNRVSSCMYFVAAVAITISFLGCITKTVYVPDPYPVEVPADPVKFIMIPITDELIAEVGGIGKAQDFQYYVSKTIFLTLVAGQSNSGINAQGQMIRIGSNRDSITIDAYKP